MNKAKLVLILVLGLFVLVGCAEGGELSEGELELEDLTLNSLEGEEKNLHNDEEEKEESDSDNEETVDKNHQEHSQQPEPNSPKDDADSDDASINETDEKNQKSDRDSQQENQSNQPMSNEANDNKPKEVEVQKPKQDSDHKPEPEPEPEPQPEPEPESDSEPEPQPEPEQNKQVDYSVKMDSAKLPAFEANSYEREMLKLVNQERRKAGVSELKLHNRLSSVARVKSADMIYNDYFAHDSPVYGSPFEMMRHFGITFRGAGENLALNVGTKEAHRSLMNSDGHRKNILNPDFTHIGIGVEKQGRSIYFTQMFLTE
ncbi:CAP domain-containing protein [Proteinivorax tanatarense]|uniref:CAP domain-containing protein n=1 Tax=Proteinivorax tanatarense TaxID=1260629 RepID=A0AAU7VLC4_9FIRM